MSNQKLDTLIEKGYDFDIRKGFENGWLMYKKYPAYASGYTFFVLSLQMLFVLYLPDYAVIFGVFLAGPLSAGFFLAANKISQGEVLLYPDFFRGFEYYVPMVLVTVIGQVITVIGFVALIIPGIYFLVAYFFSPLMVLFGGFEFWPALEYSRKVIQIQWFKFLLFGIIAVLLNLAGALLFLVGLAVTLPVTYFALYHIFESITKEVFLDEVEEVETV